MQLELEEIAKQRQELDELNKKMKQRAEKYGSTFRQMTLDDFRQLKLQKARETGDPAYLKDLEVLQEIEDPIEREKMIYQRAKKFFSTIEVKDAEKFFEARNAPDFSDENIQLRENALHLYGVDYMSTDNIRGYFGIKYMIKIEWLNDSSCNIVLPSKEVAGQLVEEFTRHDKKQADMKDQSEEIWYEFRPYIVEGKQRYLYARVATNKDVKNPGTSGKNSKYYEYIMSKLRLKKFVQNKARQTLRKKILKKSVKREAKKEKKEEEDSSSSDAQSSSPEPQKQQSQNAMTE